MNTTTVHKDSQCAQSAPRSEALPKLDHVARRVSDQLQLLHAVLSEVEVLEKLAPSSISIKRTGGGGLSPVLCQVIERETLEGLANAFGIDVNVKIAAKTLLMMWHTDEVRSLRIDACKAYDGVGLRDLREKIALNEKLYGLLSA